MEAHFSSFGMLRRGGRGGVVGGGRIGGRGSEGLLLLLGHLRQVGVVEAPVHTQDANGEVQVEGVAGGGWTRRLSMLEYLLNEKWNGSVLEKEKRQYIEYFELFHPSRSPARGVNGDHKDNRSVIVITIMISYHIAKSLNYTANIKQSLYY